MSWGSTRAGAGLHVPGPSLPLPSISPHQDAHLVSPHRRTLAQRCSRCLPGAVSTAHPFLLPHSAPVGHRAAHHRAEATVRHSILAGMETAGSLARGKHGHRIPYSQQLCPCTHRCRHGRALQAGGQLEQKTGSGATWALLCGAAARHSASFRSQRQLQRRSPSPAPSDGAAMQQSGPARLARVVPR